jgi:hypothetical protein
VAITAVFGDNEVTFQIHERKIYGEPDRDYSVTVPYDLSFKLRPHPRPLSRDPELEFRCPQRGETIAFIYEWNYESGNAGGEETYHGPYRLPQTPEAG